MALIVYNPTTGAIQQVITATPDQMTALQKAYVNAVEVPDASVPWGNLTTATVNPITKVLIP